MKKSPWTAIQKLIFQEIQLYQGLQTYDTSETYLEHTPQ